MNVEELIMMMSARCYDDQGEKQRIRENIEANLLGGGSRVRLALRDSRLFEEVIVLVSRGRYACGNDNDDVKRSVKLDSRKVEATLMLDNEYKYVTANVDQMYVPILIGGMQ